MLNWAANILRVDPEFETVGNILGGEQLQNQKYLGFRKFWSVVQKELSWT